VSATPSVTKINLVTSSVVGSLALSAGGGTQYDIAIDLSETFAYVTNLQGGIVTKINLSTFKVAATLTVETPHSIAIDPSNTYAYVTNYATGTLTKIDLSTFNLVGLPLECGDGCAGVAIASSGNIYVVNSTDGIDGTVTEIDRETFTTVGMARTVGSNPQRIAIDPLPALSTSKAGSN
jgi:DNA-binding beta-propeller fold protein YncE